MSLAQRIIVIIALTIAVAFSLRAWYGIIVTQGGAIISIATIAAAAFWLDRGSRGWLQLGGEKELAEMRSAVIAIARAEFNQERLIPEFEKVLIDGYGVRFAELLLANRGVFRGHTVELAQSAIAVPTLTASGWATPESLQRRRSTDESEALHRLLLEKSISAIVAVPCGSPTPSGYVVLGERLNGWPLTYPEIERFMSIAELMDNAVLHSRLAAEEALKVRVEHLAIMSRGLAHDLKNLITPISSFLIHSESTIARDSVEGEVHAAAWRSVSLINDYIGEALFFGNRLNLKLETTPIQAVLQSVFDITCARAMSKKVNVIIAAQADDEPTIDRVLIHRVLANLVNNAIDASPMDSKVVMSASRANAELHIAVSDTGSGIAREHRARIFEPYFTTKQMGDGARGFGLGLTICEKIIRLHGGTIRVDSELGRGTTMSVELPDAFPPAAPLPTVVGDQATSTCSPSNPAELDKSEG